MRFGEPSGIIRFQTAEDLYASADRQMAKVNAARNANLPKTSRTIDVTMVPAYARVRAVGTGRVYFEPKR